jgi:hypothetical protein
MMETKKSHEILVSENRTPVKTEKLVKTPGVLAYTPGRQGPKF